MAYPQIKMQGGFGKDPRANSQFAKDLFGKMRSGSKFKRNANGEWVEEDVFGGGGGNQTPQQPPLGNSGDNRSQNGGVTNNMQAGASAAQEQKQASYGGVAGNYGSGDVDPAEKTPEEAKNAVQPDGGPSKEGDTSTPPVADDGSITIGADPSTGGMPKRGGRRFAGVTLSKEMLAGIPENDLAKLKEAASKGFGAFKDFMRQNMNAPWYMNLSGAIKQQFAQQGSFKGPMAGMSLQRANQGGWDNGNNVPAWMQQRRAENEAARNPIYRVPPMTNFPISMTPFDPNGGMRFVDQNKDGIDDRMQQLQRHPDGNWSMNHIGVPGMVPGQYYTGNIGGGMGRGDDGQTYMLGPDGKTWGTYSQTDTVGSKPVFHPYNGNVTPNQTKSIQPIKPEPGGWTGQPMPFDPRFFEILMGNMQGGY